MQHFYDGQIRRYVTQLVRLFSNFSYKDGDGKIITVPVLYGDITRQVGHILRDNSENKVPSAPRIGVYITGLEQDRTRTADSTYTNKVNIRERAYDAENKEYLNTQGKNYTVERIMPSPYTLNVNVDIWSTNTDQKLQILEQILMLFNPSLEIQTTDNYIDWSSLTSVELTTMSFSSRSIPIGTDSEIDVAQLGFTTPIYINMPVKVKKLGVITDVVMSIFDETRGNISLGSSQPELLAWTDVNRPAMRGTDPNNFTPSGNGPFPTSSLTGNVMASSWGNFDMQVLNGVAQLVYKGRLGGVTWPKFLEGAPEGPGFQDGLTQLQVQRVTIEGESVTNSVNGVVTLNSLDDTQLLVQWDPDTIPTNTDFPSVSGRNNTGSVDLIIDPEKYNPNVDPTDAGARVLLLGNLNNSENVGGLMTFGQDPSDGSSRDPYDGPDAWKNADGTDFVANENDIVEWDGYKWHIVFDASTDPGTTTKYVTNLNTGIQYRWTGSDWILSFEGLYRKGTWRLAF